MDKLFIEDLDLKGKRVLVRVDFNVPLDKNLKITEDVRIRESLPTIKYTMNKGGRGILMSHLGRPDGKVVEEMRLTPVADRLSELLGKKVIKADDCVGPKVEEIVSKMKDSDVLLLENLRFHKEEEKNDEAFAKSLASLGDIYINDAFGTAHRAHASTAGVAKFIKQCAAGYLMKKEIDYLGRAVENPLRPFVAILGGSKISGKIDVIGNLLGRVDSLLIGGGMMFTFFKAQGLEIGKSLLEADKIDLAKKTMDQAKGKLILPVDCVVADKFDNSAKTKVVKKDALPPDWQGMDIGPETIKLFTDTLKGAKTVVWNGPLGVFEMDNFAVGTNAIAKALASATGRGAITVVGGGDSAAAISKANLTSKITHVSTGGGASLEYLEGKALPGIAVLTDKN